MNSALVKLGDSDLSGLAAALRLGRAASPFTELSLRRVVPNNIAAEVALFLQALNDQGLTPSQVALVIEMILNDRSARPVADDVIDLVTTGPETSAVAIRDTRVVVRELFSAAADSVLVVGYAVYKGHQVFQALADRMAAVPRLEVRLFLDVTRRHGDTTLPAELVRRFAERFKQFDWPNDRPMPEVYYFPLSQEESPGARAVLHAKCIVVDLKRVFVSSANFTEAAQNRNIEVGLLIESASLANRLASHFQTLVAEGVLLRAL